MDGKAKFGTKTIYGNDLSREWYPHVYKDNVVGEDEVIWEDVVTGKTYIVKIADITEIPMGSYDPKTMSFDDELHAHVASEFRRAVDAAPDEFGVGSMFSTGVGDGSAWYVVTKVTKLYAHIEWRGFEPDRYVDIAFGHGGKYTREQVERLVERKATLEAMFS